MVVVVLAAPAYRNLGQYSDFYDGGVYLESARMAAAGYAPYREIFVSQPPVWLELIRCSFTVFGQNVRAAQLLTVTALVITTVAVGAVVLDGGVWLGAVFACMTLLLSPLAFYWAREITGETDYEKIAVKLLALGPKIVAVTMGAEGSLIASAGKMAHVPAFKVNVVDSTGAGDAFCAGGNFEMVQQMVENHEMRMKNLREARDVVYNMINCTKPIISAVRGPAVGGGLVCALMSDISIVSKTAKLIDGHPQRTIFHVLLSILRMQM